jgi:4-hydroxybenzoate polyprenyltransferase|tara:strand:- start:4039 stop:4905 length:867 start_codon:yes stop_codon:yes gene_type:complete
VLEIITLFKIMRVKQWYKNIIIFLPLVFSLSLLDSNNFFQTIIGFFALCLTSSALYIRNDIHDVELDKQHPVKKHRPLASGQISKNTAQLICFILLASGLIIIAILNWQLVIILIFLIVNTSVYTKWLKDFAYLDLLSISGNFVIRVLTGMVLLQVPVSPWLIFGVFLVALFLGLMKRKSEIIVMKENAILHRKSFSRYSIKNLNYALIISSVLVIMIYSIYSVTSDPTEEYRLVYTIPIVGFIIFRQYYLSERNTSLRKFSEVINDKLTVFAIVTYIVTTLFLLYIH